MDIFRYNEIIPLDWDSKFFGYPVARVEFNHAGIEVLDKIIKELKGGSLRLTYFIVSPSDSDLNNEIVRQGGILTDQKTLFSKSTQAYLNFQNVITEFEGDAPTERLIELGLQAGKYSRFKTDKNFRNREFERLYTQWVVGSVNKSIAFKTIVALSDDKIVGMTTIGKKGNYADIGLVAVDEEFGGRGIGSDLIRYADNIAFDMKFEEIKVVTQINNTAACKLYQKCNFKIENITNIYHFWQ